MIKYLIEKGEFNDIFGLLYRLFDTRITFVDMEQYEIEELDVKPISTYCAMIREKKEINEKCLQCDNQNLDFAKKEKKIHIYQCHNSLTEGIVPLYDKNGIYLGAIFFGQFITKGTKVKAMKMESKQFKQLPVYSNEKTADLARLLKYIGEYVIENEIIKYKNKPIAEKLKYYIQTHLSKNITLKELCMHAECSSSFLTDFFKKEFGMTSKQYIMKEKMKMAKTMLEKGSRVKTVAARLGFYDEFHFSKRFKEHWGKTPKHFKTS